jgi:hypothetical protein
MHLGIAGFEPMWLAGLDTIRRAHGERLARLVGRRLTAVDLVYVAEDGSWFADTPMVLDFAGECVEICHRKFADLSITWNTIDRSAPIVGWEDSDFSPRWRTGQPPLDGLVGGVGRAVALLEWRDARDVADGWPCGRLLPRAPDPGLPVLQRVMSGRAAGLDHRAADLDG